MKAEGPYADSSVLRWLYVHGPMSATVAQWRHRVAATLPLTRFGLVELTNAIARAAFRGDLSPEGRDRAWNSLRADMDSGALSLRDMPWRAVFDRAADLSRGQTPVLGVRSLDVLHVASALELGFRQMATYGERQGRLAHACGLRVIRP